MIYFMGNKSKKRVLEMLKFKYLGEIAGLSYMLNDVIECDSKLSSDQIY